MLLSFQPEWMIDCQFIITDNYITSFKYKRYNARSDKVRILIWIFSPMQKRRQYLRHKEKCFSTKTELKHFCRVIFFDNLVFKTIIKMRIVC